jgi:hypothetical protein
VPIVGRSLVADGADVQAPKPGLVLSRRALWGAVAILALAILIGALLATGAFTEASRETPRGAPREVSVQELRDLSGQSRYPVYWAGALLGRRLEVTEDRTGNVYVRYLTGDAVVGDRRPAFTTVGTYPFEGAYEEVRQRAKGRGMTSRSAPGGGLAAWSVEAPSSVYLAYPGSEVLVEVYDPDPRQAGQLALAGEVGPVR